MSVTVWDNSKYMLFSEGMAGGFHSWQKRKKIESRKKICTAVHSDQAFVWKDQLYVIVPHMHSNYAVITVYNFTEHWLHFRHFKITNQLLDNTTKLHLNHFLSMLQAFEQAQPNWHSCWNLFQALEQSTCSSSTSHSLWTWQSGSLPTITNFSKT